MRKESEAGGCVLFAESDSFFFERGSDFGEAAELSKSGASVKVIKEDRNTFSNGTICVPRRLREIGHRRSSCPRLAFATKAHTATAAQTPPVGG